MFDLLDLHTRLVSAARPSGSEHTGIAQVLRELAAPLVDSVETDAMGNLICHKKGPGDRMMLCAHMDAIGFQVIGVDDNGFASVTRVGWHDPAQVIGCRVVFPNGTRGVLRPRERAKTLSAPWRNLRFDQLYLDIGAASREEALERIRIGDMAVFEGEPCRVGGHRVMGPYADDLIGCVVLLLTMERLKISPYDLYYVFSVQEEVGCRGALSAAQAIRPQWGIACDVCDTDDTPAEDKKDRVLFLGQGPAIKRRDASVICSPALNEKLRAAADGAGIPWQEEIMLDGGTDTCSIQRALENVAATCVSIPTRHIHSPAEIYDTRDVEGAAALLTAFLKG